MNKKKLRRKIERLRAENQSLLNEIDILVIAPDSIDADIIRARHQLRIALGEEAFLESVSPGQTKGLWNIIETPKLEKLKRL